VVCRLGNGRFFCSPFTASTFPYSHPLGALMNATVIQVAIVAGLSLGSLLGVASAHTRVTRAPRVAVADSLAGIPATDGAYSVPEPASPSEALGGRPVYQAHEVSIVVAAPSIRIRPVVSVVSRGRTFVCGEPYTNLLGGRNSDCSWVSR
jgi:hypothetical protein